MLNTWLAFLMEGMAESVALADRLGVSHEALREALRGGPLEAPVALAKLAQTLPVADAIGRRWHQLVEAGSGQADVVAARRGLGQDAMTR